MQEHPPNDPFEENRLQALFKERDQHQESLRQVDHALRLVSQVESMRAAGFTVEGPNRMDLVEKRQKTLETLNTANDSIRLIQDARAKRLAEWKLKQEQEKPVIVEVLEMDPNENIKMSFNIHRTDVLQILRATPGRYYSSYTATPVDQIPLREWKKLLEALSALPNVSIVYKNGVREEIEAEANAPTWEFVKAGMTIIGRPSKRVRNKSTALSSISSANFDFNDTLWHIPLSEAWRLPKILENVDGVKFEQEIVHLIVEQLIFRKKIDGVAMKEESPEYAMDFKDGRHLRGHQQSACEFLDLAGGNALLSDPTGLGKTLSFIGYCEHRKFQRVVILCPGKLKRNWYNEIKNATGETPIILNGRQPSPYIIQELHQRPRRYTIINYEILNSKIDVFKKDADGNDTSEKIPVFLWAHTLNSIKPDIVGMDECHYIKNMDSARSQAARQLKAERFVGITATPVINRPGEYYPALSLVRPDLFNNYARFIRDWTDGRSGVRNVEGLQELLRPIMIRRPRKHVQKNLPDIQRIDRFHELSKEADDHMIDIMRGLYIELATFDPMGKGGNKQTIFNALARIMRLKQAASDDKKSTSVELAQELYENNGEKVILFSQFKGVAYNMFRELGGEEGGAICTVRRTEGDFISMAGSSEELYALVHRFQTDPNVKYLCTTNLLGEGHTLTAAWSIIHNDLLWSPAGHEQIEGRIYGRENDAHGADSYFILARRHGQDPTSSASDTIDTWLRELLDFKDDVIDQSVEGVQRSRHRDAESIQMALIKKIMDVKGMFNG